MKLVVVGERISSSDDLFDELPIATPVTKDQNVNIQYEEWIPTQKQDYK